ncbi:uncharacterized protein LOC130748127 [Lotus japonicus]|uniref:uncharacterized protein LOC130748127 n=1 Tax=Lotus japonicus TaxID=34305 RepID=UPI002589D51B|nr:uncharacterized protein LOC130748127 [Lotus japonicus]
MGKKWAAKRQSLWAPVSNSALSREEIISDVPNGIDKDQWAHFIQYRLKPSTQFLKTGKQPSRAQLYIETHKRKDGSFINDAAMGVVEQIEVGLTQSTVDESQVSPFDTVGRVLGVERHGRVRCMGLGAVPTNTFKNSGLRLSSLSFSSSGATSSSSRQWQEKCTNLENAFKAYMIMKEGKIPEEMAQFFAPESHVNDIGSTSNIHSDESGSYNASNM